MILSHPVDKFYTSDHSFFHSNIVKMFNRQSRIPNISKRIEVYNEQETKGLDKIYKEIKGESSIDNMMGIYYNSIMGLFDRIFPQNEKWATFKAQCEIVQ